MKEVWRLPNPEAKGSKSYRQEVKSCVCFKSHSPPSQNIWWFKYRENCSDKQQSLLDGPSSAAAVISVCDLEKSGHLSGSMSPPVTVALAAATSLEH